MNDLIKVAQYGTRLEKIAAVIDELAEARDEYEAAEVLSFAEEMGIPAEEVEQAIPLFKEASAADSYEEDLVKVAAEVIDSPYATPLEKVAAMVDGVVAGAFDPSAVYDAAADLGFAPDDVDFIYETAYLDKEAKDKAKDKGPSFWEKTKAQLKDAYTADSLRSGWKENDLKKFLKGTGKTGLAYGAPLTAAGAGAYYYNKHKKDR